MAAIPSQFYQYPVNPSPQSGQGAFGAVPGAISLPNPSADLSSIYPNLSGTNKQISSDILSKLSGQLSPATVQQLQRASATFGVANGMPGSNAIPGTLGNNFNLESLGLNSEQQQQQGIQDYNSTVPTVSGTQTVNPALQVGVAEQNALNAAAPNPAAAQSYAESLFNEYLNTLKGSGGKAPVPGPSVTFPKPPPGPTETVTPSIYSPLASTSPSGSYYNGQWYPSGVTPTGQIPLPQGNMYGGGGSIDPETGLPVGGLDDLNNIFTTEGPDAGSGE